MKISNLDNSELGIFSEAVFPNMQYKPAHCYLLRRISYLLTHCQEILEILVFLPWPSLAPPLHLSKPSHMPASTEIIQVNTDGVC